MRTIITVLVLAVLFSSCQNSAKKAKKSSGEKVSLTAAGATFPLPFYNLVFKNYTESCHFRHDGWCISCQL